MTHHYLIDGNAIGYACQMGTSLRVGDQETQAVFGLLRGIRALRLADPAAKMLVLWDGNPQWRKDLYPDYKGNRSVSPQQIAMKAGYKSQAKFIEQALSNLAIEQVFAIDCEADDIAGVFSLALRKQNRVVTLVTGDKDWLQLLDEKTRWLDPIRNRDCTLVNFEEVTGLEYPDQVLDVKCLAGDSSDNIKGVGGIGEKGATDLVRKFRGVAKFIKRYDEGKLGGKLPKKWTDFLDSKEARGVYERNRKLMDLRDLDMMRALKRRHDKGSFDPKALKELCEDLHFGTFLADFDGFVRPFAPKGGPA